MTHVAGINIDEYCPLCKKCSDWKSERVKIEQQVRESAYHIISYKGSTHYAVGLAMVRITGAILRGENSVMTVSTLLKGEFGINDVCLSVPSIVSDRGVTRIIESPLSQEEMKSLTSSAGILREAIGSL
jgi:L-lactate dehydrogenase